MKTISQKQKAIIFDAERTVERFNRLFPVGSIVQQRNLGIKAYPYKARVVRSNAFVSESYEPVVLFEGLSGVYSVLPEFIDYSKADK